ncbi:MAG: nucleoside 2-deoxyribosyltransferase [Chitinophagales bacterium]|nr:nucleoside 2-deoxyribosyltransferase [Chitinophagales bacterium]
MIIVGGTYDEYCLEPRWEEKFGSGLRGSRVFNSLSPKENIDFYTFGDDNTSYFLELLSKEFPKIKSHITPIDKQISFYYDHPLINPRIFPRPDTINRSLNSMNITGKNILYYGFFEGNAKVAGDYVVYDPQSPANPVPFSKTGSKAQNLVYIVNQSEASYLAKSFKVAKIKEYFFKVEKVDVLVLKMGPKGAMVVTNKGKNSTIIPVYKTPLVWPIGTGDVFAAVFAFHWFSSKDAIKSAKQASICTAAYSHTRNFNFSKINLYSPLEIKTYPKGQVYLAGPFFTYSERWLIDQVRCAFIDLNLKVFSPWHDIGHGLASEVVEKDLKGLAKSKLVFAILDGLDSGTLFEIGYAVSKKIPVIAYVENESEESVKMLEGTSCILERDLTTAIYKTLWLLSENV